MYNASGCLLGLALQIFLLCHRPQGRGSKRCFCLSIYLSIASIANNLGTQRPSVPKFEMKVPHLWCNSHTSFKVIGQGHQAHPAAYLPMQTCHIPLVGIFLSHFRINLHITCMQYSNEGPQHCNWAQFSKIAFLILNFVDEKQLLVNSLCVSRKSCCCWIDH